MKRRIMAKKVMVLRKIDPGRTKKTNKPNKNKRHHLRLLVNNLEMLPKNKITKQNKLIALLNQLKRRRRKKQNKIVNAQLMIGKMKILIHLQKK